MLYLLCVFVCHFHLLSSASSHLFCVCCLLDLVALLYTCLEWLSFPQLPRFSIHWILSCWMLVSTISTFLLFCIGSFVLNFLMYCLCSGFCFIFLTMSNSFINVKLSSVAIYKCCASIVFANVKTIYILLHWCLLELLISLLLSNILVWSLMQFMNCSFCLPFCTYILLPLFLVVLSILQ